MKHIKRLVNKLTGNHWRPIRCIWPYPAGWACWNPFKQTSLDHGQPSKAAAQILCNELNRKLK